MAVKIGHASIDERGKISGGAAGDQTGKEICIRDWYSKPWNVLILPLDSEVGKLAAKYMAAICNDPDFGYDQSQRMTGYKAITDAGSVENARPSEFDCSSLVAACYKFAGVDMNVSDTTRTLKNDFLKQRDKNGNPLFKAYTEAKYLTTDTYAIPGAVYLKEGSHVVMAIGYGSFGTVPLLSTSPAIPAYSVGATYTLQTELNVRAGAGANYNKKSHSELSGDGQKNDKDKDGALDSGTKVTCQQVKKVGNDIWIKTPSGWLAAYYNNKIYIK